MGIENYNITPSNNGTVLATGSLVEGQAPSTLNDAIRQALADLRNFYNDPQWIEFGIGNGSTTYTRVNATTVTIPANVIDTYHVGRRVKIVDGTGTSIYGTITATAFNSPNTTITMSFDNSASIGSGTITSFKIGAVASVNTSAPTNVNTGGIIIWTTSTTPDGWLLADGSFVSKATYAGLWNTIGSQFGTPSGSQFYLPNLKDKFVMGKGSTYSTLGATGGNTSVTPAGTNSVPSFNGSASSVSGSVAISGATGSHTLTTGELPAHTHYLFANHSMEQNANTDWVRRSGNLYKSSGIEKSASLEGYQASGSDDFKYSMAFDRNNATPSVHPSSSVGSGTGHSHSFSGTANLSNGTVTPSGSVTASTFTGNSASIINPYIAMSYIIKT